MGEHERASLHHVDIRFTCCETVGVTELTFKRLSQRMKCRCCFEAEVHCSSFVPLHLNVLKKEKTSFKIVLSPQNGSEMQ